jgi:hypothetical protein
MLGKKGRMLPDRKLLWRQVTDAGLQERPADDTQRRLIEDCCGGQ